MIIRHLVEDNDHIGVSTRKPYSSIILLQIHQMEEMNDWDEERKRRRRGIINTKCVGRVIASEMAQNEVVKTTGKWRRMPARETKRWRDSKQVI